MIHPSLLPRVKPSTLVNAQHNAPGSLVNVHTQGLVILNMQLPPPRYVLATLWQRWKLDVLVPEHQLGAAAVVQCFPAVQGLQ